MDNENGLFPVLDLHVDGNGVLSFATDKKLKKNYKTFLILTANPFGPLISTLLTLSICRSSRDPLLSPNPSPSSKGVKSKHLISCGVNLR
jgi:hypothetical protein